MIVECAGRRVAAVHADLARDLEREAVQARKEVLEAIIRKEREERAEQVSRLRSFLDWLDDHPEVPLPDVIRQSGTYAAWNVFDVPQVRANALKAAVPNTEVVPAPHVKSTEYKARIDDAQGTTFHLFVPDKKEAPDA